MRRAVWLAAFFAAGWICSAPWDEAFAQPPQTNRPTFSNKQQKQPPPKQQKGAKGFGSVRPDRDTSGLEWKMSYFYDDEREVLHFADLAFPTPERGIAVGSVIDETRGGTGKPVAIITTNGGKTWSKADLEDRPLSLFFLNDSLGWMVGVHGIWKTEESGRSWKRIRRHSDFAIRKLWFLDANHGFAVGEDKTVLETRNGGKDWSPVADAAKLAVDKESVFTQIAFSAPERGLIAGVGLPERPKNTKAPRQVTPITMELETVDGGATWTGSSAPLAGQISDLKLRGNDGLAIFTFPAAYQWPTEVYRLDLLTGKGGNVTFHQDNRRVTSAALFGGNHGFLAGYEIRTRAQPASVPGRIRILRSTDLQRWLEMDVDYRAVGSRVVLAGADADHVWAATDAGMLLQLAPKE